MSFLSKLFGHKPGEDSTPGGVPAVGGAPSETGLGDPAPVAREDLQGGASAGAGSPLDPPWEDETSAPPLSADALLDALARSAPVRMLERAETTPGAAVLRAVGAEARPSAPPIPRPTSVARTPTPPPKRRAPLVAESPVGGNALTHGLDSIDEESVDEAVDALLAATPSPDPEDSGRGAASGDVRAVRDTFDQLAALHMTRVRDLMIELQWGDPTPRFLAHCQPAIRSLRDMAEKLELDELRLALDRFEAAVGEARRGGGSSVHSLRRASLMGAYEQLVALQPSVFQLDAERDRREPLVVDALLRQIPGVSKPVLDRLASAGLNRLEALMAVEPTDLSVIAELRPPLAERIAAHLKRDRKESDGRLTAPEPNAERLRLIAVARNLREVSDALVESHSPSAEARAQRRELRSVQRASWQRARLSLARIGAVDAVKALDRLPHEQCVASLEKLLEALANAPPDAGPAAVRLAPRTRRGSVSRELALQRAPRSGGLERCDLRDVDLSSANLAGTSFKSADLEGADLGSADLHGAVLRGANLRGAFLAGADLREANLQNADLSDAVLAHADLTGADLTRASLEGADLEGAKLEGARMSHADLGGADLSGADLRDAELANAELDGAVLSAVQAEGVDLTAANLTAADLTDADLCKSRLDDARLEELQGPGTRLREASLVRASLGGSVLLDADLTGTDLRFANLTGADLNGACLTGARVGGLRGTGRPLERVDVEWLDASLNDTPSRVTDGQIPALLTGLAVATPPRPQNRYFGRGDVLRHATLAFEPGARVEVDSLLIGCDIVLGEGAELIIGPFGVLANCQIEGGGHITVHGKFFERQSPGVRYPHRLVVCSGGTVVSAVRQAETPTQFAFEHGCHLRLAIEGGRANGREEERL